MSYQRRVVWLLTAVLLPTIRGAQAQDLVLSVDELSAALQEFSTNAITRDDEVWVRLRSLAVVGEKDGRYFMEVSITFHTMDPDTRRASSREFTGVWSEVVSLAGDEPSDIAFNYRRLLDGQTLEDVTAIDITLRLIPFRQEHGQLLDALEPLANQLFEAVAVVPAFRSVIGIPSDDPEETIELTATFEVPLNFLEHQAHVRQGRPVFSNGEIVAISVTGDVESQSGGLLGLGQSFINKISRWVSGDDLIRDVSQVSAAALIEISSEFNPSLPRSARELVTAITRHTNAEELADASGAVVELRDLVESYENDALINKRLVRNLRLYYQLADVVLALNQAQQASPGELHNPTVAGFERWFENAERSRARANFSVIRVRDIYDSETLESTDLADGNARYATVFAPYSLDEDTISSVIGWQLRLHRHLNDFRLDGGISNVIANVTAVKLATVVE